MNEIRKKLFNIPDRLPEVEMGEKFVPAPVFPIPPVHFQQHYTIVSEHVLEPVAHGCIYSYQFPLEGKIENILVTIEGLGEDQVYLTAAIRNEFGLFRGKPAPVMLHNGLNLITATYPVFPAERLEVNWEGGDKPTNIWISFLYRTRDKVAV